MPILGHKTYIVIKPKRYRCDKCEDQPATTQKLDWYTQKSSFTNAYEEYLMLSLINSTIQDVGIKNDVGPDAIAGILDRHVQAQVNWTKIRSLGVIGIDEISMRKGHRDFVVIITACVQERAILLGVLPDRTKATVKQFFLSIPKKLRKTVKVVCSDLYAGFISAAKEAFGRKAYVCADRFHVTRLYRNGLDSLRKKEMKRLKKELSADQYKELDKVLWVLRKPFEHLNEDERRTLNLLFKYSPPLRQAYDLCSALTSIYSSPLSKYHGKHKMRGWIQQVTNSGLTCFNSFVKTLQAHFEEITNYFIDRHTSGFVEGINNKIKVLKRRCYGMSDLNRLFQRVWLGLEGYAMFA